MPAAPRPRGKATEIAYRILGRPANMREHKNVNRRRTPRDITDLTVRMQDNSKLFP